MQRVQFPSLNATLRTVLLSISLASGQAIAQTLPLAPDLIAFNSSAGAELLLESQAKQDYWNLSIQFVTQINQAYCGVASIVMVLNSMGIAAPEVPQYAPYHVFTQENFFDNPAVRQVLAPEVVARQGMTLDQLGQLLNSHPVNVQVYHGGDVTLAEFRRLIAENLDQQGNFVIVNYLRSSIGQERGGHISPIAAYSAQSDRFLILDVARYKYPPVWVTAVDLWQATATVDTSVGKTRGFILVNPRNGPN